LSSWESMKRKVLSLVPAADRTMLSQIGLVNLAFFKYEIQPYMTLRILAELIKESKVYEPRESFYRKV